MSFKKKRGKVWYLYRKIKVPNQLFDPSKPESKANRRWKWKQKTDRIGKDGATADHFQKKVDYYADRSRLGLVNDRVEWQDFKWLFLKPYKGNTLRLYEGTFKRFEKLANPGRMASFSAEAAALWWVALQDYKSPKTRKPFVGTTLNIELRNMHAAWEQARTLKYVVENPFTAIKPATTTKKKKEYLALDEIPRLLKVAKDSESPDAYMATLIFLYTGVRLGELLSLRWEGSFDFVRGIMFLRVDENADWQPKDREENAIGLKREILEELKARPRVSEYVFPGKNGKMRGRRTLISLFNRMYKRAEIEATGVHILRHTWATYFDGPPKVKQRVLGHANFKTTEGYTHVTPEEMRAVQEFEYAQA